MSNEPNTQFNSSMEEIFHLVKARVPIIWVQTHEEHRFIVDFNNSIIQKTGRELWIWSAWQGLVQIQQVLENPTQATGEEENSHILTSALNRIVNFKKKESAAGGYCFIMRDLHAVLGPMETRQIRDIYGHLAEMNKSIIIVSPFLAHNGNVPGLPSTLEKYVTVVDYELPTHGEIVNYLKKIIRGVLLNAKDKDALTYTDKQYSEFAQALQGLTLPEIANTASGCLSHLRTLSVPKLLEAKRQVIKKSDILEYVDTTISFDDIGGLDQLKTYMLKYKKAYSDDAKTFGVEPLKGILATGVPGTGKSLTAKATGNAYQQPLLRLDIGKVMDGIVGSSEKRMREAIRLVKAVAPCILWIDEVEKGLSGTKSSNFSDGGTTSRVFGTLLNAMQEELYGVTLFCTANDISNLPAEFIRRFNEVFFVDFPTPEERWDIFGIHLKKRGRELKRFEKHKSEILDNCHNFTGAEIEKCVQNAIADAFYNDRKDVNHKDLITALQETKPLAKVMKKQVNHLRKLALDNYKMASSLAEKQPRYQVTTQKGKQLDLDKDLEDLPNLKKSKRKNKESDLIEESSSRFSSLDI